MFFYTLFMSITYDFHIARTAIPGMSLVISQNEDAFSYITDECDYNSLPDGSVPIDNYDLPRFVETSEQAHLCSVLV